MPLHGDVRVQMVQSAIRLLTSIPPAFVHALNLFVAPPRALVLLRSGYGHEGVHCGKRMTTLRPVRSLWIHGVRRATHSWRSWYVRD